MSVTRRRGTSVFQELLDALRRELARNDSAILALRQHARLRSVRRGKASDPELDTRVEDKYRGLESQLKTAVEGSRKQFERSKQHFDLAAAYAENVGLSNRDGFHALQKATHDFTLATRQYRRAIKHWCDFVLKGQVPGQPESRPV